ncbi:MAG TPA: sigma-70 family RNA polymerase sigma factor [Bryobacteraceae bacterium]|nr:sigma-70 family RNA polymerase sigma factor [Bryobacteraceae bacterium]HOQ46963.1 sigma-70 family RNA polymerase sigma factor [Bryobacteraceae bacterium]HPU73110.1 sigma-70 family RNA polymerase sigma factor [Bryobacteraceae bacterium]
MEDNDADAVERVRRGSTEAFRELVERHSRTVFRLAYRMTGNEQDAEDMVQETFLRAYRQLNRFDSRAKFSTWLYVIAANCSLDLIRARKRRQESEAEVAPPEFRAEGPSPERLAQSREIRERLAAAMDELSDLERTAFVMRHFEGVPIEEIARALGRPNGAARHSVFRAVEKLRRALEPVMSTRQ